MSSTSAVGNLGAPLPLSSLDSHQTQKPTKTIRRNLGLTPRPYFLEGELIHWVNKAKTCD